MRVLHRFERVSTHSRPKAAGPKAKVAALKVSKFQHTAARRRLAAAAARAWHNVRFNTQPPEGGWGFIGSSYTVYVVVSTHSRPKAAGKSCTCPSATHHRFNTQPPEGGWFCLPSASNFSLVSTHSRPKAAGFHAVCVKIRRRFQHTAARRRLEM